ncbi:MAG TPA: methylaspartate ammonia-lyase [Gryllotalpicola sp.]
MRIEDVLAVPVRTGFFTDDQLAIRAGAAHDGFDYLGEPVIPGFRRVRQPGEAVSVMLLLADGSVEYGDCAAVQYSGAGGRDPLFRAADGVAAVLEHLAPVLRGAELDDGFRALAARLDAVRVEGRPLHTAVRYGTSQALLAAVARARRLTPAEVIRDEYATGAPIEPVPLYAQTGDERRSNAEKMILKRVDVLPHGLINNVAEKFGARGELLEDYVDWLVRRIGELAPDPDYRPRLHLDLYGSAGLAFDGDLDAIADYLAGLGRRAEPYELAVEHPIDAGSRDAQLAVFARLRAALDARGSRVRIVVDEWCNTLEDVRAFVAARAADVIHVKTPDLGSIADTVEALLLVRAAGMEALCGGTCNETDRSAQLSAHLAMACGAAQVLAKPGMGVDEGLMIVGNEMARTAALVRARAAVAR